MTTSTKGTRHICTNCKTRYFDLGHLPAVCPKCGTQDEEPKAKPTPKSKSKPDPVEQVAPTPMAPEGPENPEKKIVEDLDDIEVAADTDDDDEDDLIEDTSELEDEDLPAVITISNDSEAGV